MAFEQRKVVMTEDCKGSWDGINVKLYRAGEEYVIDSKEMPLDLAKIFVDDLKVARAVGVAKGATKDEDAEEPSPRGRAPGASETK